MSNAVSFLTRTRRPGRIGLTDILSWVWLIGGTLAVLIPVVWAAMSSLKPEAEITRFPPSLLPRAKTIFRRHRIDDHRRIFTIDQHHRPAKRR